MSATARDYQSPNPPSTEGLDHLFDEGVLKRHEDSSELGRGVLECHEGVLPEVAAVQLGLSVSGVLKRLRTGNLQGFKVRAKRGEKWLVCPTSLPEGVLDSQKESSLSGEGVLDLMEDSSKESLHQSEESSVLSSEIEWEIHPTNVQSNTANIDVAELLRKLEGATYRIGYLESKLEERDNQIKLLTDSQHKIGWWARLLNRIGIK